MDFAVVQKLDPDVADNLEYVLAKKYFDVKEYSRLDRSLMNASHFHFFTDLQTRCAHYTRECTDQVSMFLHFYSRYMAGEKKLVEDESDKSSNF